MKMVLGHVSNGKAHIHLQQSHQALNDVVKSVQIHMVVTAPGVGDMTDQLVLCQDLRDLQILEILVL